MSTRSIADQEDDRAEHRLRHVREQSRQPQREASVMTANRQVRDLSAALLLVEDLRLRWTAVDDEGAGQSSRDIRASESDDVAVHIGAITVLHREGPRGRSALRDDQHEAGERDAQHLRHVTPRDVLTAGRSAGSRRCTEPTTVTPCVFASVAAEIAVSNTTAINAPGTRGANRLEPTNDHAT